MDYRENTYFKMAFNAIQIVVTWICYLYSLTAIIHKKYIHRPARISLLTHHQVKSYRTQFTHTKKKLPTWLYQTRWLTSAPLQEQKATHQLQWRAPSSLVEKREGGSTDIWLLVYPNFRKFGPLTSFPYLRNPDIAFTDLKIYIQKHRIHITRQLLGQTQAN